MKYRAEIDGLRALAVLPVILFHAGFSAFSGGFIGVDIFFVISGYLITNVIWREIETGQFSLLHFYERRVRRILPALFLVSLACIPFAWAWMFPDQLESFAGSLLATNLFASNIFFWHESGYFAEAAELKPLLHTWSLAVEEQFYLVFPLLLMALAGLARRRVLWVVIAITITSLLLAEYASRAAPSANFYLLPSRAWELGAGAISALLLGGQPLRPSVMAQVLSATGAALICGSIVLMDEHTPFPGFWAILPVGGTMLVIAAAGPTTVVGKALGWRPAVAIGLVSYSAYLWHQPLFAFARIRSIKGVSPTEYLLLALASLVLAAFSWRFVEQPFRKRGGLTRKQVFVFAGAAAVLLVGVACVAIARQGFPARLDSETRDLLAWKDDYSPYRADCHNRAVSPQEACVFGSGDAPPITVWGDSHGVELAWQLAEQGDRPVRQLTSSACLPAVGVRYAGAVNPRCPQTSREILDYLTGAQYDGGPVILVARWSLYFEGEAFTNDAGATESDAAVIAEPADGASLVSNRGDRKERLGMLIRQTVARLRSAGRKVVLVYPVPEAGWSVPQALARIDMGTNDFARPLSTSYQAYLQRSAAARRELDMIAEGPDMIRIDSAAYFCDVGPGDRCLLETAGHPLYWDDDHLNRPGARLLADAVIDALRQGVTP